MVEHRSGRTVRTSSLLSWAVAASLGVGALDARADRIVLRGGGQLRGKVLPVPGEPGKVEVLTESGKTPLIFRKEQVGQVIVEPGILDEYLSKRDALEPTASAHHELARWCAEQKLADLAERHDLRAIEIEPDFAPSREALGHVRQGDRWLTADEFREHQGLVKHKGRWITREEKERIDDQSVVAAQHSSWARQIRVLRLAMQSGDPARRLEAEQQVRAIKDPAAVRPLLQAFGQDPEPFRTFLAGTLGAIPGIEASRALVDQLLAEDVPEVRTSILAEVRERNPDDVFPLLARTLKSKNPPLINRAAWALGQLDAVATVPSLVGALTTIEERWTWVQPSSAATGPSFYSGYGISVPVVNAVVAPGAVAFGATAVPLIGPAPSVSRFGTGPRGEPIPVKYPFEHRNVEVRAALRKLTGQDFGFDVPTWKRWVAASFRAQVDEGRRVPQP